MRPVCAWPRRRLARPWTVHEQWKIANSPIVLGVLEDRGANQSMRPENWFRNKATTLEPDPVSIPSCFRDIHPVTIFKRFYYAYIYEKLSSELGVQRQCGTCRPFPARAHRPRGPTPPLPTKHRPGKHRHRIRRDLALSHTRYLARGRRGLLHITRSGGSLRAASNPRSRRVTVPGRAGACFRICHHFRSAARRRRRCRRLSPESRGRPSPFPLVDGRHGSGRNSPSTEVTASAKSPPQPMKR